MLKASSLSNAIFVCLMISIFSGCLVLISHYQNLLNSKLDFRETLINTNNATFKSCLLNPSALDFGKILETDIFNTDLSTYSSKKKWGFYDIITTKTVFKDDTIKRIGLVGSTSSSNRVQSLFLTNYDNPLKLSGVSQIIGTCKVPNGYIEETYINGKAGNNIIMQGQQLDSEDKLPQINITTDTDITPFKMLSLSSFKSNTITNSFDTETIVINVSNNSQLSNISIKGNIIVFSNGNIKINKSAQLNDIIVISKSVLIEEGFSGNLQIVAKNDVIIEENSQLKYPSSIYINNDIDSVKVHFKAFSKIAGGIIITGATYNGSLKRKLIIDKSSQIYGSAYCYGSTQLQGEIMGQLFTDRFFLKTSSSEYENTILNGSIYGDSLPNNFVQLPLFNSKYNSSIYEVIKEY